MLQGRARHEMPGLEAEQPWDTRESTSLEAKEFGEQVTDGAKIYFESG